MPWQGLLRWAFIWLLYLDTCRIQMIPISGLQVENWFGLESSIVLMVIHLEGVRTQGISVLVFLSCYFACDICKNSYHSSSVFYLGGR